MTCLDKNRTPRSHLIQYATSEEFCQAFADNLSQLYVLSFLMTGDHEMAEQCFVAGLEESVDSNYVFSEWVGSWAKRTIIQSTIRALKTRSGRGNASFRMAPKCDSQSVRVGDFELCHVLALQDFERCVFVMSVLERTSDHDCALLLGCSLQEVREARIRALEAVGDSGRALLSGEVPTWRASRQVLAALNALAD
jgi:DNA-directed RNA polymerase specialized sigma24 family protein